MKRERLTPSCIPPNAFQVFARKIIRNVTEADIANEITVIEFIKSVNGHKNILEMFFHGWFKGAFRVYYIDMELAQTTLMEYIAAFRTRTSPFNFLNSALEPEFLSSNCTVEDRILNVWAIRKHLADGLVFLHGHGYAHRDIKPSNGKTPLRYGS
jgi:serine/threonine protein kinase